LATWDFTGQPGSEASVSASSTAPGVTAGDFSRSSSVTAASGSGSINSTNWTTSATADTSKYYTLSVAPPAGCTISVAALSVNAKSSSTGPSIGGAATSDDSYTALASLATNTTSTPILSVANSSGSIEIRLYGYGASGSSGTMRIQGTFTVSGAIQ
jgi:hypothetical protein